MDEARNLADTLRAAVADEQVIAAMAGVPRDVFVVAEEQERAYENIALPIDCGQTISQPVVVARMLELLDLKPSDRVLDVGTGSGYHAALLARLADHVWTVERHPELTARAAQTLAALGIENVTCLTADGSQGLVEQAPFDAINVAAAGRRVPAALLDQLAEAGRLIAPVGGRSQRLVRITRRADELFTEPLDKVRFVPLVRGAPRPREPGAGA